MRFPLLLAIAAAGHGAPGQDSTPSFRTGARVVEIMISATRAGNKPVADLRAEDLRIFDNGREQAIASFEKTGWSGAPATEAIASTEGSTNRQRPLTFILLDAINTSFSDQWYGRQGVSRMLSQLPPGDRIAIFALGDSLHMLHDISTDYASLRAAVEKYEGEQSVNWVPDLNREPIRVVDARGEFDERKRILDTLRALTEIAEGAKGMAGPKKLIWVSSAFPTQFRVLLGGNAQPVDFRRDEELAMRKLVAGHVILFRVSAQGLRTTYEGDMKEMAEQTGGTEFVGSNDVSALIRGVMDEPREGYLLTFVPTDYVENGSFHQVVLKTSRKGIELRYRPGYVAESR